MSSDQNNPAEPRKPLSEISHLFLSGIRDKATGGVRPTRLPPGSPKDALKLPRPDLSVDLTPEEFAQVYGTQGTEGEKPPVGTVSALIASHLNGRMIDRVRAYARHLAGDGKRIGLLELDAACFRVMCFDRGGTSATVDGEEPTETFDALRMTQAMEELAWDIDHWLLLLPNPRTPEARALLRQINHWVLLSTCDHDGVVSGYRAIKGLSDGDKPRLTLALLDASDPAEAAKVYRNLSRVCEQFLGWSVATEPAVQPGEDVVEHTVIHCAAGKDKSALPDNGAHWKVASDFIAQARQVEPAGRPGQSAQTIESPSNAKPIVYEEIPIGPRLVADLVVPHLPDSACVASENSAAVSAPATLPPTNDPHPHSAATASTEPSQRDAEDCDVTDLPSGETTETAVLAAVLAKPELGLLRCPVLAPMCPQSAVAINRDRRLVLLAVTRQGLSELRAIGQAYRWLNENRALVAMAMPQLSIDAHAMPALRILVDRADLSADILQPLLQSGNVIVQTYRKLRWGSRTGLLLEAA